MRKEDNSPQGKIVTELLQHLHACKNNCDVFYGREDELEKMKEYITGPSQKVNETIRDGFEKRGLSSKEPQDQHLHL